MEWRKLRGGMARGAPGRGSILSAMARGGRRWKLVRMRGRRGASEVRQRREGGRRMGAGERRGLSGVDESLLDFKHLHERVNISGRHSRVDIESQTSKKGLCAELGEDTIGEWRDMGRTGGRA